MKEVKPYNKFENKKTQIRKMFDNISKTYDFLNFLLSFNMDKVWRRKVINKINNNPKKILDIATGTADVAILAAKFTNAKIIGVDISEKMIDIGNKKIERKKLNKRISLSVDDAEKLPFKNNSFQAATSAFGVRNFSNIDKGLSEIFRVLDKNGILVILEPSKPSNFPIKQLYYIYFTFLIPLIGKIFSRDKLAYKYFIKSVNEFYPKKTFIHKLKKCGFKSCKHESLTFGLSSIYTAIKK